jgi:hypothetical protein
MIKLTNPKKLWILRFYVALLSLIVEFLLGTYVALSLYNLIAKDNFLGDMILGYAGLYLVWISLATLFVAQVVTAFISIHDNIEDVRNKLLDSEFKVDLIVDKTKNKEASIRSFITIVTIILSIILSLVNLNRQNKYNEPTEQRYYEESPAYQDY